MDSLGNRMKNYEHVSKYNLTARMPTIIRIDGKAFHSFTKGFEKPFDFLLMESMQETMRVLCEKIDGVKLGYTQSDEISLLLTDYENLETQAYFNKSIQKMVSISASIATLAFNNHFSNNADDQHICSKEVFEKHHEVKNTALFDSRVFILPKEEVCNYFIWRQQDATRNSIQMVAQANFFHRELQNKNTSQIQDMLFEQKGINFNNISTSKKRGSCAVKIKYDRDGTERTRWVVDNEIPIFTQDREYIDSHL